jgi:hypothetical protein
MIPHYKKKMFRYSQNCAYNGNQRTIHNVYSSLNSRSSYTIDIGRDHKVLAGAIWVDTQMKPSGYGPELSNQHATKTKFFGRG